jgi:predicted DNA-binding transcriptional regulator AlpA
MSEDLDSVRVISRNDAIKLAGVSTRTWDRMEAAGMLPPKTRISERRIGYRVADLKAWLDARRVCC